MKKNRWLAAAAMALSLALLTACGGTDDKNDAGGDAAANPESTASADESGDGGNAEASDGNGTEAGASDESAEEEILPAPDFTLKDWDGKDVSLSDYRGRVVVLNFWASWCPPCKAEMPDFQELHEKWTGADDPVMLGVNLADGYQGETMDVAKAFLDENGFTFPVLFDEDSVAASIYTSGSIPVTYVIDQEGYVYAQGIGQIDKAAVEGAIEQLMAEGGSTR